MKKNIGNMILLSLLLLAIVLLSVSCAPSEPPNDPDSGENGENTENVENNEQNGSGAIESPTTYTVTFLDHDGTTLKTESVESGKSATAPDAPEKYGFIFKGWDKPFDNVTSDLTVTAVYESDPTPRIIVESKSVKPGTKTVTVRIMIYGNPGLASMKLTLSYSDQLTLTTIEFDNAFGAYVTAPEPYTNPQTVTFISPLTDITANGVFATLTFTIEENAAVGNEYEITVDTTENETFNGDFENVTLTETNGKITVIE